MRSKMPLMQNSSTKQRNRLRQLTQRVSLEGLEEELKTLLNDFGARVILTAHPTQFYPGPVLAIITDLTAAIKSDVNKVRDLLQQLGDTPFFRNPNRRLLKKPPS